MIASLPPTPPASLLPLVLRYRAYDSESTLIAGGSVPDLVCGSAARVAPDGTISTQIFDREGALVFAEEVLDSDYIITGANLPFDLSLIAAERSDLLPYVFLALAEGRVHDVLLAQALDAIAGGHLGLDPRDGSKLTNDEGKQTERYNLWNTVRLVLGRDDAKESDAWRKSYGFLRGFSIDHLPPSAQKYMRDDVRNPLEVTLAQVGLLPGRAPLRNLDNLPEQVETAFGLQLGGVRGVRTDRARVEALRASAQKKRDAMQARYQKLGFLREDGSEDKAIVRRAVALAYGATGTCPRCGGSGRIERHKEEPCRGEKVRGRFRGCAGSDCVTCAGLGRVDTVVGESTCQMPDGGCDGTGLDVRTAPTLRTITTDTGHISTARDTLMESGNDDLHDYGESEHDKILDTYIPFLEQGVDRPITLSANAILETTRVSYNGPIQLLPQRGGVRDCFVPRDGYYFCSVDYAALELCSLAQVCLHVVGSSRMAEVINSTRDPGMLHTSFAARMVGVSVEEMARRVHAKDPQAKNARAAAKAGNFTFGGGGGAATTVLANRQRSKGTTKAPDGFEYAGIRFCILLDGAERCGEVKVTEWGGGRRRRTIPPTCARCLRVVQEVLRPSWYKEWPEVGPYFDWVTRTVGTSGRGTIPCFGRKFWQFQKERGFVPHDAPKPTVVITRGGVGFSDGANNGFQSWAAMGAKFAWRNVVRESYLGVRLDDLAPDEWVAPVGPGRRMWVVKRRTKKMVREATPSPLAGTRPIIFIHDEIFSEMPEETAHLAGPRKAEIMRDSMRVYLPDVYVGADPALMRAWLKDAEPTYRDGKLVCWEPSEKKS